MSLASAVPWWPNSPDTPTVFCRDLAGLKAITRPGVDLVCWQRELDRPLTSWIANLGNHLLPHLRLLVHPRDIQQALPAELDACGTPACLERDQLVADVQHLAKAFADITASPLVDLRLEAVDGDACWKFHRDCVEARLITTYRGAATQWVQPADGARAIRQQRDYTGPIEDMGVYDVAIFKGSCAGEGSGIVHRSPPIAGSGQIRLLLVINKRFDASPLPWQPPQP